MNRNDYKEHTMYGKRIRARIYVCWCGVTLFIYVGIFVSMEDPVLYPTHRSYWKIDQVMNHMPLSTNNAGSDVPELNVSCKIDELAASAISRAKTASCKQHLADVACRIYKDILFPKKLPRFCPSKVLKTKKTRLVYNEDEVRRVKPVRIVFVFTVTGRAVRQIRRLLKAIYHVDHYYYIHVDNRADFLYRELLKLEDLFPNVRLVRERFATIWGGASRLQAHFSIMKTLLAVSNWTWDYYINLSETHYPLKKITSLAKYLQRYQGNNFIQFTRTLEPTTIKEKNFFECDEHLWQLGNRKLPEGVIFHIGPDWICLHRDFVEYAVTGTDPLLTGLKEMYKYTVSPVESFFHTLLHNSEFCESWINENMHVTRWVTERGCSCHRDEVDWCGCSPMVIKQRDFDQIIVNLNNFPKFWSRKFEPIIDQEVLNSIDKLLGIKYKGNQSIHQYWQNEFHFLDKPCSTTDLITTFANSFIRRSVQLIYTSNDRCELAGFELIETHVLNVADKFDSYLVKFSASHAGNDASYTLECRFSHIQQYRIYDQSGIIERLWKLQVGTIYDTKEEIFRNYPGFLGPRSTGLTLHYIWKEGAEGNVTFSWMNPSGKTVSALEKHIGPEISSGIYKLETNSTSTLQTLQTGIWKIVVHRDGKEIAELQFLVVPIVVSEGQNSVKQKHQNMLAQIDELTTQFWKAEGLCSLEDRGAECPQINLCRKTNWSSMSPDPKSDITVDDNGNIIK